MRSKVKAKRNRQAEPSRRRSLSAAQFPGRVAPYMVQQLERRVLLSKVHVDPFLRHDLKHDQEEDSEPMPVQGTPPEPYAPPLGGTIEAVNFDGQAGSSGFYNIPPDNSAAAGPTQVVNVVNTVIQWFTKAGAQQNLQRLGNNGSSAAGSFFASLSPLTGCFD